MSGDLARYFIEEDRLIEAAYLNGKVAAQISPEEALEALREGNRQFCSQNPPPLQTNPTTDAGPCEKQRPIAVVICCSDSRVPPELVFWQGIGRLFVIRNAGNTLNATAVGSLEYAVSEFETPLIVVMGHERCGAVEAAFKAWKTGMDFPGSMSAFVEPILPAVIDAHIAGEHDVCDASIKANVTRMTMLLRSGSGPILIDRIRAGTLRVVGARYDFTGKVDFFDVGQSA